MNLSFSELFSDNDLRTFTQATPSQSQKQNKKTKKGAWILNLSFSELFSNNDLRTFTQATPSQSQKQTKQNKSCMNSEPLFLRAIFRT